MRLLEVQETQRGLGDVVEKEWFGIAAENLTFLRRLITVASGKNSVPIYPPEKHVADFGEVPKFHKSAMLSAQD